jgi:DNA-binding HxlR family transcriptional regulator
MKCSIARTLDVIGEPWSPLILRDVMVGIRRFDQIQADLGVSRKVLTERLKWLVDRGVLDKREYSARPLRHEYVLTDQGVDLCDVLIVMARFGDRWLAGTAGPPVLYRHHACGQVVPADQRCAHCDGPLRADTIDVVPGPGTGAVAEVIQSSDHGRNGRRQTSGPSAPTYRPDHRHRVEP